MGHLEAHLGQPTEWSQGLWVPFKRVMLISNNHLHRVEP